MMCKLVRFWAVLFLCAGCLSGCQVKTDVGGDVLIEPQAPDMSGEKTLTFFAPVEGKSSGAVSYRKMIDQYNKTHDVQVVFEGIATADGYNEYLEERLDAGKGDDIFIVNEDSVKPLYSKGYLYDMSSLPAFQKLDVNAKEEAIIGDTAYCMPMDMTAYAMYVNLDVLEQYGLKPPESLEEFDVCCRRMKEQGGTPISLSRWHATAVPTIANGLYRLYGSPDYKELIQKLNTGDILAGDYMLEGFQMFRKAMDEGWYGENLTAKEVDGLRAGQQDIPDFAAGRTAFYFGPLEYIPWVTETNPQVDFQVQGVPVPGKTVLLTSMVSRLCVNADSASLEDALDFVSYLSEECYRESVESGEALLPVYGNADFVLNYEQMRPAYETYLSGGRIPAENMQLKFGCWDTVRELCLGMADGMTAREAADEYNKIQMEQIIRYNK